MSVNVIHDPQQRIACLYDTVTDTAFGPVLYDDGMPTVVDDDGVMQHWAADDALLDFLEWLGDRDARQLGADELAAEVLNYLDALGRSDRASALPRAPRTENQ